MENLKKLSKHILGIMIALCGLLFVSHPVYAGTIVLDNANNRIITAVKDNAPYSHIYSVSYLTGATTSKANLKPIIIDYGTGHYCVLSNVDEGGFLWYKTGGFYGYDITSIDDYLTGSVEVEETKIDDSTPNLLSFYKSNNTGYTGSASMYDYMISKGYSAADLDKYLNHYKIVRMTGDSTPAAARADGYKVDLNGCIVVTPEQLYSMVKTAVDTGDGSKIFDQEDDTGDNTEPPKFYLKTYNAYGMNKYSEYTLTWDTKGSFVEGKESDYGFKVYIAKENKPSDAKVLDSTKISPCLFSASSLVFTWQDVKDLFSFLSTSKLENRFDVFIQITDKSGKAVSDNYIHFLVIKRMEIRDSNYVDRDGNEKKSYGKWENGQFEYTDGRETSAEDKTTNGNGSSTAPSSNVKNDGYTNVENAPSSSNIDASATKSLINSLSTIASMLGDVPALIAQVYSWLPVEVITLIGTGIGLIVVVGIIKWVL